MRKTTQKAVRRSLGSALGEACGWFAFTEVVVQRSGVKGRREDTPPDLGNMLDYIAVRGKSELDWSLFLDRENETAEFHVTLWIDKDRADPDFLITFTSDGAQHGWSLTCGDDTSEVMAPLRTLCEQFSLAIESDNLSDASARRIIRRVVRVLVTLPK